MQEDSGSVARGWIRLRRAAGIAIGLALTAVLGIAVVRSGPAAGRSAAPAGEAGGRQPESPDDPPYPLAREALRAAPSASVVRGNHVSVQVNVNASGLNILDDAANEPSLAVDPSNPARIAIGWRQFDSVLSNFREGGYAFTTDGGASWTFPGVLQDGIFRSDPVLGSDASGVFYYYSLSSVTTAEMFRSSDGGATWAGPFPAFGGDKTWMAVDTTGGAGDGRVHALWNSQFTCCAAGTDYMRSGASGTTFEGPWSMPVKVKWGTMTFGPGGPLYVVGAALFPSDIPRHSLLRSSNAGDPSQTPVFEHTVGLDLGGITVAGGVPNPIGLLGQVWVATDHSAGPTAGNVYVLASVDPPGPDPQDVMFIRSADLGVTWTPPIRVSDGPPGSYQWFGTFSVAPDGRIDVIWNDTRIDASGTLSEVYYAYSTDAGDTWSAGLPVTPAWDSLIGQPNQEKIGDYYHMFSDAVGAGLAFAATFNDEQDVWFLRVGDCNATGVHDARDIALGTSADCNDDGIPDECQTLVEVCDDGVDNDCDLLVDCADPGCAGVLPEICDDGVDNDCDLDIDCDDADCTGTPECPCNFNGVCEAGEFCDICSDCFAVVPGCGNGVCETETEDCVSCPADCFGDLTGEQPFCCGGFSSGHGQGCFDIRCVTQGFLCGVPLACCGDGFCDYLEGCFCEIDCGPQPSSEGGCADGVDNDCDQLIDCADFDCIGTPACPSLTSPSEASPAGQPMIVARGAGTSLLVSFTPSGCATDHVIYGGFTDVPLAAAAWSAQACGLGASSPVVFDPGDPPLGTLLYFVIVGNDGITEGSYGQDSNGAERPEAAGLATCDFPQAPASVCP